jgi:hypothetical protein
VEVWQRVMQADVSDAGMTTMRCLMLTLEIESASSRLMFTADEDYFVGKGNDSTLPRQH